MADSGAPTFIKRSKNRTTRARATSPSQEKSSTAEELEASPITLASKIKKQHKERTKPKARLSFGGDDEVSIGSPWFRIFVTDTDSRQGR